MSDERIAPEVIEAAIRAEMDAENTQFGWGKLYSSLSAEDRAARHEAMEAAIRAALDELGLKVEYRGSWRVHGPCRWGGRVGDSPEDALRQVPDGKQDVRIEWRFISPDWRPVERPT